MTVLAQYELRELLERRNDPLVITPLLNPKDQIGDASIDVRLGSEFIVIKKRALRSLDFREHASIRRNIRGYQERVRIEYTRGFVLHPNQLVLGSTLEYVKLPTTVGCHVIGRSSWGRLGLVIETASAVAPCFSGAITLELLNVGEVPIVLYPGVRIAQLVFHSTSSTTTYSGRYKNPTGPQFSRVYDDKDLSYWCPPLKTAPANDD